ncbi:MAG: hypothetical protein ACE5JU_24865 [Candidatus Binatia bacterium]
MHSYAVEGGDAQILPWWMLILAAFSVGFSYLIHIVIGFEGLGLQKFTEDSSWLVGPPSALAIFAGLYRIFDNYLWKVRFFRIMLFVSRPDLNSKWEVEILSPPRNTQPGLAGELRVCQTWSKISITLDTNISQSRSLTAAITHLAPHSIKLTNEYSVDRKVEAPESLQRHVGTNQILIEVEKGKMMRLDGEYYTERNRGNYGDILFKTRLK